MYKKNEIYIDVVESINLLMSKEGQKLSEEAVGQILLRTYLSGTPQCKVMLDVQSFRMMGQTHDLIPPSWCTRFVLTVVFSPFAVWFQRQHPATAARGGEWRQEGCFATEGGTQVGTGLFAFV
jgi:hypothetical protein